MRSSTTRDAAASTVAHGPRVEKLQHLFSDRYVVQLIGVGWEADPPYYIMEYMQYGSLEDRLRAGALTSPMRVRIIRETAQGLVHAHDKGILHCDLKPSNIMWDPDGMPRLADFGQARLKHDRAPSLGTLFYMAPEQADLKATPDARWTSTPWERSCIEWSRGNCPISRMRSRLPFRLKDRSTSDCASIATRYDRRRRLRLTAMLPASTARSRRLSIAAWPSIPSIAIATCSRSNGARNASSEAIATFLIAARPLGSGSRRGGLGRAAAYLLAKRCKPPGSNSSAERWKAISLRRKPSPRSSAWASINVGGCSSRMLPTLCYGKP